MSYAYFQTPNGLFELSRAFRELHVILRLARDTGYTLFYGTFDWPIVLILVYARSDFNLTKAN